MLFRSRHVGIPGETTGPCGEDLHSSSGYSGVSSLIFWSFCSIFLLSLYRAFPGFSKGKSNWGRPSFLLLFLNMEIGGRTAGQEMVLGILLKSVYGKYMYFMFALIPPYLIPIYRHSINSALSVLFPSPYPPEP